MSFRFTQEPAFLVMVFRCLAATGRSYAMESCRGKKNGQFTENAAATGRNRLLQSCRGWKRGKIGLNSYATGSNSPLQSCRGREFVSLGPPHSDMAPKKQLPNIVIINELLPSFCPVGTERRIEQRDWTIGWDTTRIHAAQSFSPNWRTATVDLCA